MERRKFIGSLTSPVLAACAVCMGACSKGSNSPGGVQGATGVNFTLDLSSALTSVGSSVVQSGVIVVRLATGNLPDAFTAVQVSCTHEGTSINYNASGNNFVCPNHGSTFTTAGAVTLGPANSSLKKYNIAIAGNIMTVTG
jgi:Rieske Fe-S protein